MSLEIIGLTKRFGDVTALDAVSLKVDEGELLAVVGPSGCGKTTLIRVIAGLETPDAGRVVIRGKDATSAPTEKRNVSLVFQNFALFPHMSVEENVAYGLRWKRLSRAEKEERVREALEMVGLSELRRRKPHQLSAGQQQRTALARALAPRPETLLLDEPLSALDADLRDRLRLEIRRIQKELGITTILVTHDQEEALGIADRVAVMNQGALVQVGPAWEVYDAPASAFVARFIGKGNLIEAQITESAAEIGPLGSVPLSRIPPAFRQSGKALVLIRPEALRVLGGGPDEPYVHDVTGAPQEPKQGTTTHAQVAPFAPDAFPDGLTFRAELTDVTFTGQTCTLHLQAADRPLIASAPGVETPRYRQRVGRSLTLYLPYASLRWVPLHQRRRPLSVGEP